MQCKQLEKTAEKIVIPYLNQKQKYEKNNMWQRKKYHAKKLNKKVEINPLKNKEDRKKWPHKFEKIIKKPKITNSELTDIFYSFRSIFYIFFQIFKLQISESELHVTGIITLTKKYHAEKVKKKQAERRYILFWLCLPKWLVNGWRLLKKKIKMCTNRRRPLEKKTKISYKNNNI